MPDLLTSLADFDRRRGKEPIDPTVIQGGTADMPLIKPEDLAGLPGGGNPRPAGESYGEPVSLPDFPETPPEAPRSPLIEAGLRPTQEPSPAPQSRQAAVAALLDRIPEGVELWVQDGSASFRGRPVDLNEADRKAVAEVLLMALRRSLEQQFEEVAGRPFRRPRKRNGSPSGSPTIPPKRTRRPRGSLLGPRADS